MYGACSAAIRGAVMALMKFRRGNRIERGNHLAKRISCVFVRNKVPCVLRIFRDAFKGLLVLRL